MSDSNYRQRAATPEYLENWDRIYLNSGAISTSEARSKFPRLEASVSLAANMPGHPTPVVECPGPPITRFCDWCGARPGKMCEAMFDEAPIGGFHALRYAACTECDHPCAHVMNAETRR